LYLGPFIRQLELQEGIGMNDSDLVQRLGDALIGEMDAPGIEQTTDEMRLFFDVYCFDMELGSGASYDQYFHWASKLNVESILKQLEAIGLEALVESTSKAIKVAFPNGIPTSEDEFEDCLDWSEKQEDVLVELYEKEENLHALVEEKLAEFARKNDLMSQL
jgi:hypothetical protein